MTLLCSLNNVSLVLSKAKLDRALQAHQVLSVGEGLHPLTCRHRPYTAQDTSRLHLVHGLQLDP